MISLPLRRRAVKLSVCGLWLSRWLEASGLTVDGLTVAAVEEFFRLRKAQGHLKWLTWRSVSVLLGCLGIDRATDGVAPAAPGEAIMASYPRLSAGRAWPGHRNGGPPRWW
jgi:hypothetical protein